MTNTTLNTTPVQTETDEMTDEEFNALPAWKKGLAYVIAVTMLVGPPAIGIAWTFGGDYLMDLAGDKVMEQVQKNVTDIENRQAPTL